MGISLSSPWMPWLLLKHCFPAQDAASWDPKALRGEADPGLLCFHCTRGAIVSPFPNSAFWHLGLWLTDVPHDQGRAGHSACGSKPSITGAEHHFLSPGRVRPLTRHPLSLCPHFFPQSPCKSLLPYLSIQNHTNKLEKMDNLSSTNHLNIVGWFWKRDSSVRGGVGGWWHSAVGPILNS